MASAAKDNPPEPASLDEFARIAVLFLRYLGAPQRTLIIDLSELGLQSKRVAELVGTTPNTVSQEKKKPRSSWPTQSASAGGG